MKRAFVYCRVSTEEQSRPEHHSLRFQEDHCREYAKRHKWRVEKVRRDVGSGKDDTRGFYPELLTDIESGAIDVVITYRLDRLSRNVRDVYDFLKRTQPSLRRRPSRFSHPRVPSASSRCRTTLPQQRRPPLSRHTDRESLQFSSLQTFYSILMLEAGIGHVADEFAPSLTARHDAVAPHAHRPT